MTHTELHDLPRQPERKISSLKIPKPLHSLPRGRRCPGGRKVGAVGGAAHGEERGRGARREIELQQRHVVGPRAELPARAAAPRLAPPPRAPEGPHSMDFADFKKKSFAACRFCQNWRGRSFVRGRAGAAQAEPEGRAPSAGLVTRRPRG
jgi:hypothetical protein